MTDATILIPTHRHAAFLPCAIESALDQSGVTLELFILGDGVEDATRRVVARFSDDPRVRFFDLPKGARLGEAHRHGVLEEASGRIVAYLSDDDLLLPRHVCTMLSLLGDADFAHPVSAHFEAHGSLQYFPWNYGRPIFRGLARGRVGSIGLTGTAHTLGAYRRLPFGWRTTPAGMPTDHWMWLQFLDLPGSRSVMGQRLTYLAFPETAWGKVPEAERAATLAEWFRRSREPGFEDELEVMLRDAIRRAAEDYHVWARREQLAVEALRATRTWRLRTRLLEVRALRRPRARRS